MCASDLDIFFYVCSDFRVAVRKHPCIAISVVFPVWNQLHVTTCMSASVGISIVCPLCADIYVRSHLCASPIYVFTLVSDIPIHL